MSPRIGFVLITHKCPPQIERLANRLTRMFDGPPIVCHHDFSKCNLETSAFGKNVDFVRPHLTTRWADYSVVEATTRAIDMIRNRPRPPEWIVLLSGADYPIKPADRIVADLTAGGFDAHLHFERIEAGRFERPWQESCFNRYCTHRFQMPWLNGRLRPVWRDVVLRHPLLTRPFLPYSSRLRCFAGSQWININARAAERIVAFDRDNRRLANHCRKLMFSEETYFQTIVCSDATLRVNNEDWRYIDWCDNGAHPKTLDHDDLPLIMASSQHFARKFDFEVDVRVLDALDEFLGLR